VLTGFVFPISRIRDLTLDLLRLKQRFFPGLLPATAKFLDWAKAEIKGAELRKQTRDGNRDERRAALVFKDAFLDTVERHEPRLLGRLYVKGPGQPFNGRAVYTSAVQSLAQDFQSFLGSVDSRGFMVLDSRDYRQNINVSHSVFTQKFRSSGDAYDRLMEMPLFGHSDNHAGIQTADLLCSAFLFPMATASYSMGSVTSVHVHPAYNVIRQRFGPRIKELQYRYQRSDGPWRGGLTVCDSIAHRSGAVLFDQP